MSECTLCPRSCKIDRSVSKGFCKADNKITAVKAYLHKWEEPCISGENGSGTIFFSPCNMKCVFCQNYEISHFCKGVELTENRLCEIMLDLQSKGAHNINLVTPTPYADKIAAAIHTLGGKLDIPVVYNCSGYESVQTIEMLKGAVDIFIPDIKFKSSAASQKYLHAPDYYETALCALDKMITTAGEPVFENGLLKSGVIVRHLVMPNYYRDSLQILDDLSARFKKSSFLLSLMSQYFPCGDLSDSRELCRKTTTFEYKRVCERAAELGFDGYTQDRASAEKKYVPNFDFEGVI